MQTYAKSGHVYSVQAHQWGFKTRTGKLGYHPDGTQLTDEDKTDVLLYKDGVDISHLNRTCLFNVAGQMCYHDSDGKYIYLKDARYLMQQSESNHIGIISFEELGDDVNLAIHPIQPEWIHPTDTITKPYHMVSVAIPDVKFKHHLVGLVLCGELHFADNGLSSIVRVTGENIVTIDFHKWGIYRKLFQYKNKFPKKLKGCLTNYLDNRISMNEVRQDDFIPKLLSRDDCFLFIVGADSAVSVSYQETFPHQLPMRYYHPKSTFHPSPLIDSDGHCLPYFIQDGGNELVVIITEMNQYRPLMSDTVKMDELPFLQAVEIPTAKSRIRTARFIHITKEE